MTLKELRISKGMNQIECAKYLGMSTRNYQNYENNANKVNTAKYNAIYQRLSAYAIGLSSFYSDDKNVHFHTNVVTDLALQALASSVAKYAKRNCYQSLQKFIQGAYDGKICILYGLRRTGKTTLVFQMIGELPIQETAYIKVQTTDNMSYLTKDLHLLFKLRDNSLKLGFRLFEIADLLGHIVVSRLDLIVFIYSVKVNVTDSA